MLFFIVSIIANVEILKYKDMGNKNLLLIADQSDGQLEVMPSRGYHMTEGVKVWDNKDSLTFEIRDLSTNEVAICSIQDKKKLIELRDYLTKFIEKEEDWFSIEEIKENN